MSSFSALARLGQEYTASVEAEAKQRAAEHAKRLAAQAAQQKASEEKRKKDAERRQKQMQEIEEQARLNREKKKVERVGDLRRQVMDDKRKATPNGSPKPRKQAGSSTSRRSSTPVGMTWEEKRKAREASMFRESPRNSPKKTTKSKANTLNGVDLDDILVVEDPNYIVLPPLAGNGLFELSTRQRIAAMPTVLTKLNTEKRDLRNPLEVQMELQQRSERAPLLEKAAQEQKEKMERREKAMKAKREREERQSREARHAKGIYSDNEESAGEEADQQPASPRERAREPPRTVIMEREKPKERHEEKEKLKDKDLKPIKEHSKVAPNGSHPATSSSYGSHASTSTGAKAKPVVLKSSQSVPLQSSASVARPGPSNAAKAAPSSPVPTKPQIRTTGLSSAQTSRASPRPLSAGPASTKRKRLSSPSDLSDDSRPVKKQKEDPHSMLAQTLTELFGSRSRRPATYDDYDDDDMEATGEELWREEQRSARLAKIEDERARREEEKHEEEKRRKKLEKLKGKS